MSFLLDRKFFHKIERFGRTPPINWQDFCYDAQLVYFEFVI